MKARPFPKAFLYAALSCEAKPLIDCYKLKKDTTVHAFGLFRNDNIVLTVTGIGKVAMAAGVAYSQALHSQNPNPVLVNIGIAGHQHHPIGGLFLADKITDNDTGRRFYPPLVFTPPCPTAELVTFAKPQTAYPETALCDMEASAFYDCGTRFASGEMVHCLKIVSDNTLSPATDILPKQVSSLIAGHVPTINGILAKLAELAREIARPELEEFNQLIECYRFTDNEKTQLKKLLLRWCALKPNNTVELDKNAAINGKGLLKLIKQQLDAVAFQL
jgi:adenosylhomocysteine nucleosidase